MTIESAGPPFIYLAPIRGLTDALFREVLASHFGGFDAAIAPFINPQNNSLFADRLLRDVLPENNRKLPVIPQLLHTRAEPFAVLARRLADLGFSHINWNLGCPAPMVARKKRGSGLLPYPEEILAILDKVMPALMIKLSIKTRLGYHRKEEILTLLPELDNYPLEEIIIHSRLGVQLYRGETDPNTFASCQQLSKHRLVYNGDITEPEVFSTLARRFNSINSWMIGRGALANPMLAEQIKGLCPKAPDNRLQRLEKYHIELLSRYQSRLSGPSHILGRLKLLWSYLISSFPGNEKLLKKIQKSHTIDHYQKAVDMLFDRATV
jgi:tRNA-dihydrouridine synthase B